MSKLPDIREYQIPNWVKYQTRSTNKFLCLYTNHPYDPKIQSLTCPEYRVWIYLLSLAAHQDNNGRVSFLTTSLQLQCNLRTASAQLIVDKLLKLQLLASPYIDRKIDRKTRAKDKPKKPKKEAQCCCPNFEHIWDQWPRKASKVQSLKAWKKFVDKNGLQKAISVCQAYLASKPDKKYCYALYNFFNQQHYENFTEKNLNFKPKQKKIYPPDPTLKWLEKEGE